MSEPLELTIYPRVGPERRFKGYDGYNYRFEGYDHPDGETSFTLADCLAAEKRLTEAELCAEYESARCDAMIQSATGQCWSSLFDTWSMDPAAIHNRERTLLRFASRPHYFEATEPESDTE